MSPRQQLFADRIAIRHGRVHVSRPYADDTVSITAPDGMEHRVNEDGAVVWSGINLSIDWSYS